MIVEFQLASGNLQLDNASGNLQLKMVYWQTDISLDLGQTKKGEGCLEGAWFGEGPTFWLIQAISTDRTYLVVVGLIYRQTFHRVRNASGTMCGQRDILVILGRSISSLGKTGLNECDVQGGFCTNSLPFLRYLLSQSSPGLLVLINNTTLQIENLYMIQKFVKTVDIH